MDRFWTCWVENTSGGYGHQHPTPEEAYHEAERLARLTSNRGHKVFVMELECYCVIPEAPIEWHQFIKEGK